MKKENFGKAKELLEELESYKEYKNILSHRELGKVAHFVFTQHYGNPSDYEKIHFSDRHTKSFIPVVEGIIEEIEKQLKEL